MKRLAVLGLLLLGSVSLNLGAPGQSRPRLVVGIVIDQFRYDYLERFSDLFGGGGFRRLMQEGAVFADAQYLHSATVTSVGHSTFLTGSIPVQHGIVANQWFDRATGKAVSSVTDDSVTPVGSATGKKSSPRRLVGSTVGDELKLASGGTSRVIGISMKDSAAILMAGHHPDAAYWFDSAAGHFVTSSYYMPALPAWLEHFNAASPAKAFLGSVWKPLRKDVDYQRSGADDSPFEVPTGGSRVFPHKVDTYDQLLTSPFSNEVLEQFAKTVIENEGLGEDETTDLLAISFSGNDEVGHEFGPYSHEVEDVTLRTDLVLADLFRYLDRRIGRENYVVAFTADHGVAPIPEAAMAMNLGGGRFTEGAIANAASGALSKRYGQEKWILSYQNENLYLDEAAALRHHVKLSELARVAADAVLELPEIAGAYTTEDFESGRVAGAGDVISQRIARNFYRGRTGDVMVIPKPYYQSSKKSTGHGTPYSYDTNVPVILMGDWFSPGLYYSAASPADIAPTLSSILHITRPSVAVGRVLTEALR